MSKPIYKHCGNCKWCIDGHYKHKCQIKLIKFDGWLLGRLIALCCKFFETEGSEDNG